MDHKFVAGLLLAAGLVATGCTTGKEEPPDVKEAKAAAEDMVEFLEEGEIDMARDSFARAHEPMHTTATQLEPQDPNLAEVVNDIAEVLEMSFNADPVDSERLSILGQRALDLLVASSFVLEE